MKKLLPVLALSYVISSLAMQNGEFKVTPELARQKILNGAQVEVLNGWQNAGVRYEVGSDGLKRVIVPEGTEAMPTGNVRIVNGIETVEVECIQQ